MTVPEAATFLKMSESKLNKMRSEGKGPLYSKAEGVGIRYLREDLEAYVKNARVRPVLPPRE